MTHDTHDGYGGEHGTYLLADGQRIAVDPITLAPLAPADEPDPVTEKTQPAATKKAAVDTHKPE